ncbi:MAG TPA: hypothetical protein DIU39_00105, partial [Flavobacteriales bacterium]|nr:hypothetical protein [Flavobacteriales bacterium]
VTGTDTNACSNMDTLIITVNPLPNIFAGNDTVSCKGGSVQLTATGGISYVWSPAADLSDNAIANPVASPDSTTVYTVVGTDANGCSNSDSVVVDIFYFIFDNDTTICFGDQIQLQVSNNMQSVNTAYNWSPGTLVNDSTIAAPTTLNTSTTTFTVFAYETALGCVDSSAITVTVEEVTQPDFDYTAVLACEGLEVSFINKTNNANFVTWDFGDGETSQEIDPVHTYAFNNNYTVILSTGVNSKCTTDTVKVIDVKSFDELFDIQISNVLTPNGDGKNDYFKVQIPGKVNECTQITIFNRWGEEVYSSDNYSTQWDGRTPSGKFVPAGTYYYIVDINGMDYKGSITVIR